MMHSRSLKLTVEFSINIEMKIIVAAVTDNDVQKKNNTFSMFFK